MIISRHRRAAFTLIELLVVIAIIAILAALIFPATRSIQRKSQQTVSSNNLRQWGAAFLASLQDYNNMLPTDGVKSNSADINNDDAWFNRIPPYAKQKTLKDLRLNPPNYGDRTIWVNPAVPQKSFKTYRTPPTSFLFSYSMNYYLYNDTEKFLSYTRIENPAACVLLGENATNFANCNPKYLQAWFGSGDPLKDKDNVANFLMCDGHVVSKKRSEFDQNYNPAVVDEKNLDGNFTFVPYVGGSH
jgi:prepilin-type N-terminal cleavage/methylation domain-containing protein/prepilin-type processing-associated H-X9-DG protein